MNDKRDHDTTGQAGDQSASISDATVSRRGLLKTMAAAGAATAISGFPYIRVHAAETD
jgi:hypothetical protein